MIISRRRGPPTVIIWILISIPNSAVSANGKVDKLVEYYDFSTSGLRLSMRERGEPPPQQCYPLYWMLGRSMRSGRQVGGQDVAGFVIRCTGTKSSQRASPSGQSW